MIILILLFAVVIAVFIIRGQMHRQHREMMSAVNPERLAALDAAEREEVRRQWTARLSVLGGIIFLIVILYGCGQGFKGFGPDPVKTESNEPAKAP
jgi:hypothetical protein